MKLKGKSTALAAAGLGFILLLATLAAFRESLLEEWYLRQLDSEDDSRRSAAIGGLAELRSAKAIPRLERLLMEFHDEAWDGAAVGAILRIDPTLRLVTNPDLKSRFLAKLKSLSSLDPAAVSALVEIALKEPAEGNRRLAAFGLEGVGAAVPPFIHAFTDADPAVRARAITALGEIGPVAIDRLIAAASDKDELVRQGALAALGLIGEGSGRVVAALASALADEKVLVREAAAWGIWTMGFDAAEAIPDLIRAIGDPGFDAGYDPAASLFADSDHGPRTLAILALGRMNPNDPQVIPALLKVMEEGVPPIRRIAAKAILGLGPTGHFICRPPPPGVEVLPALAGAYRSLSARRPPEDGPPPAAEAEEEAGLRLGAVSGIAQLAGESGPSQPLAIAVLLEALRDPVDEVRAVASDGLGGLGSRAPNVVDVLIRSLQDPNADFRQAAARTLSNLGTEVPKATEALLQGIRDPRHEVRSLCAKILQEFGGDPAVVVPALARILGEGPGPARALAAETLGFYAHTAEPAIPHLTRLLDDGDRLAREAAAAALEKIRKAAGNPDGE
jgi:HEAT repeat protein